MAQDFETAKAFLKQANDNGSTLYDHLTNVLLKIIKEKPDEAMEAFENLSVQVKKATLQKPEYKELPAAPNDSDFKKRLLTQLENEIKLLKVEERDEDDDPDDLPAVPDMVSDAQLFEWAGVGLGPEETYKIMRSVTVLAQQLEAKSCRFFGKIYGTEADYLIVEASIEQDEEELEEGSRAEPSGTGANEYVYFVTNSPEGKWTRLPNVTPEQIIAARSMRRFFSGDLNAPVLGFPRFPWGEAAYLRAQIARIDHACSISPRGFYVQDDDVDEDAKIENEEFEVLSSSELKINENWTHHRPHLLKQARCTKYEEPENDDEEEEEILEEEEEEEDEPMPFLSGLDTDEDLKLKQPLWSFREAPSSGASQHNVAIAISLNWPGAVAVAKGKQFANVYLGYGHKYLPAIFTPPPPPAIESEFAVEWNPDEEEGPHPLQEQNDPQPPANRPDEEEEFEELDEDEY